MVLATDSRTAEHRSSWTLTPKPTRLFKALHASGRFSRQLGSGGSEIDRVGVDAAEPEGVVLGLRTASTRQSRMSLPMVEASTVTLRQDATSAWRVRLPRLVAHRANWALTWIPLVFSRASHAAVRAGRVGVGSDRDALVSVNIGGSESEGMEIDGSDSGGSETDGSGTEGSETDGSESEGSDTGGRESEGIETGGNERLNEELGGDASSASVRQSRISPPMVVASTVTLRHDATAGSEARLPRLWVHSAS